MSEGLKVFMSKDHSNNPLFILYIYNYLYIKIYFTTRHILMLYRNKYYPYYKS